MTRSTAQPVDSGPARAEREFRTVTPWVRRAARRPLTCRGPARRACRVHARIVAMRRRPCTSGAHAQRLSGPRYASSTSPLPCCAWKNFEVEHMQGCAAPQGAASVGALAPRVFDPLNIHGSVPWLQVLTRLQPSQVCRTRLTLSAGRPAGTRAVALTGARARLVLSKPG